MVVDVERPIIEEGEHVIELAAGLGDLVVGGGPDELNMTGRDRIPVVAEQTALHGGAGEGGTHGEGADCRAEADSR